MVKLSWQNKLLRFSPLIALGIFIIFISTHLIFNNQYKFPDGISLLSLGKPYEISAFFFFLIIGIFLIIATHTYIPKIYENLVKMNPIHAKKIVILKSINMVLAYLGIIGMILQSAFNLNIPFSEGAFFKFLTFDKLNSLSMIIIHHILAFGAILVMGVANILLTSQVSIYRSILDQHSINYKKILSLLFGIFLFLTFCLPAILRRNILVQFMSPFFHQISFIILCILFFGGFVYDYDNLYLSATS